jgi:hypothetical protein
MKKLLSGVKRALASGPSSRGSGSRFGDNISQDSPWSSSFMPSLHGTAGLSCYLAQDDVSEATNGNDISIRTTDKIEKYESHRHREFAHTRIYDVTCLRGLVWMKSFPPSSGPSVGENSTTSLV